MRRRDYLVAAATLAIAGTVCLMTLLLPPWVITVFGACGLFLLLCCGWTGNSWTGGSRDEEGG